MPKQFGILFIGILLGGWSIYMFGPKQTVNVESEPMSFPEQINNATITGYALPSSISFAGEEVPLDRADVMERLDREVQVNAFWHSNAVIMIKRSHQWLPILDSILVANNVPSDFKYLAVAESGLQNVVSPANAVGFWQFLKGTAKDFGLKVNREVDQRYDPILATVAAAKYLKQAHKRFGDWTIVAASYNMGVHGATQVVEKQRATNYYDMVMSEEPSRYVFRIIALKNLLENPANFSFDIKDIDKYSLPKTRLVKVKSSISDWNDFAQQYHMTYYQLKKNNAWIRSYSMIVKPGQVYQVKVLVE
ncbi:MAG: lytic transglycosylase domain-containing protein [Reichenbachiella sp.]